MNKELPAAPFDPLQAWRDWFVKSEREWSESLTRLMKEDSTARAVGQEITAALYAQQMIKKGMAGTMAMMNMPTQDQLADLSDRLGSLEDAVARVESGLTQLRHSLGGTAATGSGKPREALSSPVPRSETETQSEAPRRRSAKAPRKSRA